MASEMMVIQYGCEGLLRFIVPDGTVTVDMEIMTLKGIHILSKIRTPVKKLLSPGVKMISLHYHF